MTHERDRRFCQRGLETTEQPKIKENSSGVTVSHEDTPGVVFFVLFQTKHTYAKVLPFVLIICLG